MLHLSCSLVYHLMYPKMTTVIHCRAQNHLKTRFSISSRWAQNNLIFSYTIHSAHFYRPLSHYIFALISEAHLFHEISTALKRVKHYFKIQRYFLPILGFFSIVSLLYCFHTLYASFFAHRVLIGLHALNDIAKRTGLFGPILVSMPNSFPPLPILRTRFRTERCQYSFNPFETNDAGPRFGGKLLVLEINLKFAPKSCVCPLGPKT